jgi:hypothetical protein
MYLVWRRRVYGVVVVVVVVVVDGSYRARLQDGVLHRHGCNACMHACT